jgi:hypothetical protein
VVASFFADEKKLDLPTIVSLLDEAPVVEKTLSTCKILSFLMCCTLRTVGSKKGNNDMKRISHYGRKGSLLRINGASLKNCEV